MDLMQNSRHPARLVLNSATANLKASFGFLSWFRVEGNARETSLQSKLVLWLMFVIQLMHSVEAAGCAATSIQLAPSATVHHSANYF